MKNRNILFAFLVAFLLTTFTSCEFIGDIFRAGIWTGIIIVALVVILIIWIISKITRRRS